MNNEHPVINLYTVYCRNLHLLVLLVRPPPLNLKECFYTLLSLVTFKCLRSKPKPYFSPLRLSIFLFQVSPSQHTGKECTVRNL